MSTATSERVVALQGSGFNAKLHVSGDGPALLYFHGNAGHSWTPLHDQLAARFTVYAPLHPAWDDPADLDRLDDVSDLVLYYMDLMSELGLESPIVVGHSFGGMVAAELAARYPAQVSKLALIAPLGLWRDDQPVADLWGSASEVLKRALWVDPDGEIAVASQPAGDPDSLLASYMANTAAAHFVWPIPDRNLRRRLHRITAPTLLIWGREDGIVPFEYASDFESLLKSSRTLILDDAAHNVHLEQPSAVAQAIVELVESTAVAW